MSTPPNDRCLMRKTLVLCLVCIMLLGAAPAAWAEVAVSPDFTWPRDPMFFQPGRGQAVANTYCLICHSADYVYTQPPHSRERWHALVVKMQKTFGCPIPDDQIDVLSSYLFEQNSVTPPVKERHP